MGNETVRRIYEDVIQSQFRENRQMAFVTGPRQVGKTFLCRERATCYLNWDNQNDRDVILRGPDAVAERAGLHKLGGGKPVVAFDEIHKYARWKQFLKGFFDVYGERARIMVTGSSRLDVYRRGGDSMMGRYFLYHMHPISVGELAHPGERERETLLPKRIAAADWQALNDFGGFPEPFVLRNARFLRRWCTMRRAQLLREDVRDLTRIQDVSQMESLAEILSARSGDQIVYAALGSSLRVSENTARAWIAAFESLHYGFLVRPWSQNIEASIKKQPKWYLRDWSRISDAGKRAETLVACHLLKAVDYWTDLGFGDYSLRYIRDKTGREVDFLVVKDGRPWMLVEVKTGEDLLSPALGFMQERTQAEYTFQVVMNLDFVDADCFTIHHPVIVPAQTFLSQLP